LVGGYVKRGGPLTGGTIYEKRSEVLRGTSKKRTGGEEMKSLGRPCELLTKSQAVLSAWGKKKGGECQRRLLNGKKRNAGVWP